MSSQNSLHDDIVAKVSVNTTRTAELNDIRSALEELLIRLTSEGIDIEYDDILYVSKVSKLQPCGSMQEGTSQWKSARYYGRERLYIEFDYLAVLNNRDNFIGIREVKCKGCRKLYSSDRFIDNGDFEEAFLDALYERINSQCSCIVEDLECYSSQPDQQGTSLCSKCTAERGTGILQIAKAPDFSRWEVKKSEHCSIVFLWTSHTGTLLAPNVSTLQPTEIIKRLVIRTDFLPAWEISNDSGVEPLLVVPKRCSQCDNWGTWLVSYCMYELKAIKELSDYHRNCYSIIKFLYGQFTYWCGSDTYLKSYHAKVAFLTHCETCQAESGEYINCVINILQSLVKTYETCELQTPVFHANKYLKVSDYRDNIKRSLVLFLIDSVHKMTTNSNRTYSEIIKDTVRQIIEEGVWITTTSDGKTRLEKQCNIPASTIRQSLIDLPDFHEDDLDVMRIYKHVRRCGCSLASSRFRFQVIFMKMLQSKVPEDILWKQEHSTFYKFWDRQNSPLKTISQSITDSEMTTSTTSDSGGDPEGSSDLILDSDLNVSWSGFTETDFGPLLEFASSSSSSDGDDEEQIDTSLERLRDLLTSSLSSSDGVGEESINSILVHLRELLTSSSSSSDGDDVELFDAILVRLRELLTGSSFSSDVDGEESVDAILDVLRELLKRSLSLRDCVDEESINEVLEHLRELLARQRKERSNIKDRITGSSNVANPSEDLPEKQEQEFQNEPLRLHPQQLQEKLKQLQEQQKEIGKEQQLATARRKQLHHKRLQIQGERKQLQEQQKEIEKEQQLATARRKQLHHKRLQIQGERKQLQEQQKEIEKEQQLATARRKQLHHKRLQIQGERKQLQEQQKEIEKEQQQATARRKQLHHKRLQIQGERKQLQEQQKEIEKEQQLATARRKQLHHKRLQIQGNYMQQQEQQNEIEKEQQLATARRKQLHHERLQIQGNYKQLQEQQKEIEKEQQLATVRRKQLHHKRLQIQEKLKQQQ